ncbi:hypothetical protein Hamer_G013607, partial [Homarus americanus]
VVEMDPEQRRGMVNNDKGNRDPEVEVVPPELNNRDFTATEAEGGHPLPEPECSAPDQNPGNYGKVEGMRPNKYTKGPAAGLLNGTKTFKVILKNNIPSLVTVGSHSLTFLFAAQRKTWCYCNFRQYTADCFNLPNLKTSLFGVFLTHSRADGKEGEESVAVSHVPATTRYGIEREEVPAQTTPQDAVDPDHATHPNGSENAIQETSTTCKADIHTERNNADQTKGKISYGKMEYDKAVDDMVPINMTGTECEVARGENMNRIEEIVESPSRNKNDTNKTDQNKPGKNESEINHSDDENQVKVKTDGGTDGDISKISGKKD